MKLLSTILLFATLSSTFAAQVDLAKSSFTWTATKKVGSGHTGIIKLKEAKLNESSGQLSSGSFVVNIKTVNVTDLSGEWKAKFLGHIKSADFFNVEKFPTASFKISKVKNGQIFGTLTIKGKSKRINMSYKKKGNIYESEFEFDRTKFDMVYGSDNFFKGLGDKVINDTVKVKVKLVLK